VTGPSVTGPSVTHEPSATESTSYAAAGVSIEAGDRAVELMKASVKRTDRPEVLGGLGGFAGLFALDLAKYAKPVLASSTDGVGTKIAIAQAAGRHDTIGIDLVAMVVDDLVVVGAEPLFMSDYIATGKVDPDKIAAIVSGIAEGCVRAGCALIGGETAEHPGVMPADDYDVSGTGVGVVDADRILGAHRLVAGDVLIALGSSGLHSNGYSLVRHVLFERAGFSLDATPDLLGGTRLVEELLEPTRIYAQDCLALAAQAEAHGFAHITGGGLAGNLVRVLPEHLDAVVDRSTWAPSAIFQLIAQSGPVALDQLELTLNLGVGMIAVVPAERVESALTLMAQRKVTAWRLGEIVPGVGEVRMTGTYAGPASSWR
jgi:phosphoribosylformylglycinamidine cyclo-ligase